MHAIDKSKVLYFLQDKDRNIWGQILLSILYPVFVMKSEQRYDQTEKGTKMMLTGREKVSKIHASAGEVI